MKIIIKIRFMLFVLKSLVSCLISLSIVHSFLFFYVWPLIFHTFHFYIYPTISVMRGEHRSFILFERRKENHFLIGRGIFNSSSDAL